MQPQVRTGDFPTPIGRDGRHPRHSPLCQGAPAARVRHRQRDHLDDCPRSDAVLPTLAGREICVASSKAFTCQLAVLACLAIAAGRVRGVLSPEDERVLVRALIEVPRLTTEALALEPQIEPLAIDLAKTHNVLYLGRGTSFPLAALEGAAPSSSRGSLTSIPEATRPVSSRTAADKPVFLSCRMANLFDFHQTDGCCATLTRT